MNRASEKIRILRKIEPDAILYSMAMMAYNPSIGRVLKKGGVNQFVKISKEMISKLENVHLQSEFEMWHAEFIEKVKDTLGTTSRGETISYGQAQKPINVFLKVYVDWANLPKPEVTSKVRSFLHVPLDQRVMKHYPRLFPEDCKELKSARLSEIGKDQYYAWQQSFRKVSPEKPLLIDNIWAFERFKNIFETATS